MPAYESTLFSPPAPLAKVVLRDPTSGKAVPDVPMLLDSGADVTLLPIEATHSQNVAADRRPAMAGALLDTNAVSDLMRDHPSLKARVAAYPGRLCTSVLVRGEIRYGRYHLANAKEGELTHEPRHPDAARRAAEEAIELARVLAGEWVMSGQEFLERMARSDDMAFLNHESDGMTHNIVLGALVAREMLEAGEYEDVVHKWAEETQRRWRESKFFKLWQAEQQAGRDPNRSFRERGWQA